MVSVALPSVTPPTPARLATVVAVVPDTSRVPLSWTADEASDPVPDRASVALAAMVVLPA